MRIHTSPRLFLLGLVATCSVALAQDFVPGRVLVEFRNGTTDSRSNAILTAIGARVRGTIPGLSVQILSLPAGANEQASVNTLKALPEVAFAELDRLVAPAAVTPNDPYYANWEWHLTKISAPTAWSTTTGSASITIAILDTGVYAAHPDLSSKLLAGWNTYSNTSNTNDVYGHGTQVAGAAAALSNNGTGVASVAWGSPILPVKISDDTGLTSYSAAAAGLTWAADHGARVANMSYALSDSSTVTSGAQYFWNKGGVVVMSAGNSGAFDSASDNPYVLTVSGTDSNDVLYSWSNTGNNIDLSAPGSVYTTTNSGAYSAGAGTSFSAPIVAGVAALVLSVNPGLTPAQVVSVLQQNADDLGPAGWDTSYGWGRVNAARAVSAAAGLPAGPAVSFQSPLSGSAVNGVISAQVSATDTAGIVSVSLYTDNVLTGTLSTSPYTWSVDTTGLSNGGHSFSAVAKDTLGYNSSAAISVTVSNTVLDTTAPSATITSPANGSTVSASLSVSVSATDNVRVASVDLLLDNALIATSTSSPYTFKLNTKNWAKGAHSLQARAHDAAGNVGLSTMVTVYK